MHPLDEFKREVVAYLPGLLVLFDIADAKGRNAHLGHQVVDRDIAELDRLVRESVGTAGLAKRVGGDEWLAIYANGSLAPVAALLKAYHREQEFLVGWRATGERDGQIKVAERTVPAKIVRALRCLYVFSSAAQETDDVIEQLLAHNYSLPTDTPCALAEVENVQRRRWTCVTNYPSERPFCPFCAGHDFDWDDGDTSVYAGSGRCKICGAAIEITGIEK